MKTFNNEIAITSSVAERRNLTNEINILESKKIIELNNKINSSLVELQERYEELSDFSSPIVKNKILLGLINKTDVDASFNNILCCIQNLAKCTLGAFQTNGENLEAILDLIKMSVVIENDLYKLLEDSDCSKESIANLLHDLCFQYNIDSKAIESLFEQSFTRTITLRDRINALRKEVFDRILKYEEKFENLDETISKKEKEIIESFNNEFERYNSLLEDNIANFSTVIDKCKNELEEAKKLYNQEIEFAKKELKKEIIKYNKELSEQHNLRFEEYQKENNQLNKKISKYQNCIKLSLIVSLIATTIAAVGFFI
jgi:hypothetical protein